MGWQRVVALSELQPPSASGQTLSHSGRWTLCFLLPPHDLRMSQLYPLRGPKHLTSMLSAAWSRERFVGGPHR